MYIDGTDPIGDSSIYMKNGKIGLFNDSPVWPVQIDASVKTTDIYVENAIKDTSGNILLNATGPVYNMGQWSFEPSGNNLILSYGGSVKFTFASDGSLYH